MTHENYIHVVNEMQRYDAAYFSGSPLISDQEYDLLYFAVQDYEKANPSHILPDSPTQKAHAEIVNGHRKVYRRNTLLSIEKAKSPEELIKWMQSTTKKTADTTYTVEWKYDGICASLIYVNGMLVEASYGKKDVGMDFLQTALYVPSIPKEIPAIRERIEIRGEVVVMQEHMEHLSTRGYKDCRSAASGILADTNTTLQDYLTFIPYWTDLPFQKGDTEKLRDRLTILSGFGFYTHKSIITLEATTLTAEKAMAFVEESANIRPTLPYPTDGMVIKVQDMNKWDSLGKTAHHYKSAIAYKFPPTDDEKAITIITKIEETVGETGKLTPIAYIEPVHLKGRTFDHSSVGSWDKLHQLGLYEGAIVCVSIHNGINLYVDSLAPSAIVPSVSPSVTDDLDFD